MKLKRILIRISNLRAKTRRLEDKADSIYKKYKEANK